MSREDIPSRQQKESLLSGQLQLAFSKNRVSGLSSAENDVNASPTG